VKTKRTYLNAYGPANLFELTSLIDEFIAETELINGSVMIFSVGSTGALVQLGADNKEAFSDWVMSFIPYSGKHRHPGNAFAHLRSTALGSSYALTVESKKIKNTSGFYLLENTAGRKQRPLELRAFGEFAAGGRLNMKVASNTLPVKANGWIDIVELSEVAADVVFESGIIDGFLNIESLAKKSAISTTEYEGALLQDTADFIAEAVSDVEETSRGDVAAALIGRSMNFPIKGGRLELGTWQQPVFLDFGEPGEKEIFFQAIGM